MRISILALRALLAALFLAAPATSQEDLPHRLVGKWEWSDRVRVFHHDGTGTVYGMHTYMDQDKAWEDHSFTWSLDGNVLHDHSDENRATLRLYRDSYSDIEVQGNKLIMTHMKSGYQSVWTRSYYAPEDHM